MATYNHFHDLPVYKICRGFRKKISTIARKYFPKSEEYLLKSQTLDSSRSITANIAEGFGRFRHQENIQFCRQSRGSLDETLELLLSDKNRLSGGLRKKALRKLDRKALRRKTDVTEAWICFWPVSCTNAGFYSKDGACFSLACRFNF